MSSATPTKLDPKKLREQLSHWLSREVTALERIGGGRNSQVYRVEVSSADLRSAVSQASGPQTIPFAAGSNQFALKLYFRHPNDPRDRLATEFNGFAYLWAHGFRQIPQPLAFDAALGWALYEFIEGERVVSGQPGEAEVQASADFLGRLRELSRREESRALGIASEACFAPRLLVENVRHRLERLREPAPADAIFRALADFLSSEISPFLEQLVPWSRARLEAAGESFADELARDRRTLSPSDFGFHNALRRPDGRIIFLDFEYFGWDDPAKMIADFLLHPAMDLSAQLKRQFATAVLSRFEDWPGLRGRLESVYPLYGMKWCMILLNEFLPEALLRRRFAALAPAEHSALQLAQLAKARQMLERIRGEFEAFPYA